MGRPGVMHTHTHTHTYAYRYSTVSSLSGSPNVLFNTLQKLGSKLFFCHSNWFLNLNRWHLTMALQGALDGGYGSSSWYMVIPFSFEVSHFFLTLLLAILFFPLLRAGAMSCSFIPTALCLEPQVLD